MPIPYLDKAMQLARGQSYWRVKLTSGREVSEFDEKIAFTPDPVGGRLVARSRKIEWREDLIGSGDTAHIAEVHLVTPKGDACLFIGEAYTAFQTHRGTALPMAGGLRIMNAQIIGRVDNKETGECTAVIWDVQTQCLYTDFHTKITDFAAWRPGIAAPGSMNWRALGVELR